MFSPGTNDTTNQAIITRYLNTSILIGPNGLGGANPAVNTPRPINSRGTTRIESYDSILS